MFLDQVATSPTGGPNILDLCFTTHPNTIQYCYTILGLSNHNAVIIDIYISLHLYHTKQSTRMVYMYYCADWGAIREGLRVISEMYFL